MTKKIKGNRRGGYKIIWLEKHTDFFSPTLEHVSPKTSSFKGQGIEGEFICYNKDGISHVFYNGEERIFTTAKDLKEYCKSIHIVNI